MYEGDYFVLAPHAAAQNFLADSAVTADGRLHQMIATIADYVHDFRRERLLRTAA